MGTLGGISGKQAVKKFEQLGYTVVRQKGSHVRLRHPSKKPLTIPLHKELKLGLLRQLIQDASIDVAEFLEI